jgi:hypothetical protein
MRLFVSIRCLFALRKVKQLSDLFCTSVSRRQFVHMIFREPPFFDPVGSMDGRLQRAVVKPARLIFRADVDDITYACSVVTEFKAVREGPVPAVL